MILEKLGSYLSAAGYAFSWTGIGLGVAKIGNVMQLSGKGITAWSHSLNGNLGWDGALGSVVSAGINIGIGKLSVFGANGSEVIESGVNLFFTPTQLLIDETQKTKYNKK